LKFPARRGGVSLLLPPSPFSKPTYLNETGLPKRISRQTRNSSVTAVSNATDETNLQKSLKTKGAFEMKTRSYMVAVAVVVTFAIWVVAYAQGPGGGSGGGSMMGGGHGMMGGSGHGMTGYSKGISYLWELLSKMLDISKQNDYNQTETLREQIREKTRELASLYRSENADKKLIDQKIDELNRLESKLDKKMAASNRER
jgi:Spy/CpxP family protein refolding chaperone